jgi:hypothetical protein
LPPVSATPVVNLELRYLRDFSKKFETVLIGHSGVGGKLIHKKNQRQKISWHCPFKNSVKRVKYLYVAPSTDTDEDEACVPVSVISTGLSRWIFTYP